MFVAETFFKQHSSNSGRKNQMQVSSVDIRHSETVHQFIFSFNQCKSQSTLYKGGFKPCLGLDLIDPPPPVEDSLHDHSEMETVMLSNANL